jgi:ubiquinone/menaquinone biosynthesis C-methylase UbiE
MADDLPGEDRSFDADVVDLVLCTVPDQEHTLTDLFWIIKPSAELRIYQRVIARRPLYAPFQRLADVTFWPRLLGGCRTARDTSTAIECTGFLIESCERFTFSPVPLFPMPHILGVARRPH